MTQRREALRRTRLGLTVAGPERRRTARASLLALEIGRAPLAVAALMFAAVFALRLAIEDSTNGVSLLFSVPIVLITIAHGTAAGAAAASVATGLVVAWVTLKDVQLGPIGLGMRAVGFYAVPWAIWLGRIYAAPSGAAREAAPAAGDRPGADPGPRPLTRRESEILGLLAAGHTNAEIADQLVLSVRTVETHRANLQRKLGRPSRRELVSYARREGLIPRERGPHPGGP